MPCLALSCLAMPCHAEAKEGRLLLAKQVLPTPFTGVDPTPLTGGRRGTFSARQAHAPGAARGWAHSNMPIPCFGWFRSRDKLGRLGNRLDKPIRIVCIRRNLRCAVLKRFDLLCIRPTEPSLKRRLGRHAHIVCIQYRCHKFLQHET